MVNNPGTFTGKEPDIIIKNGTLITMVPGEKPISDGMVLIYGDVIGAVGAAGAIMDNPPSKGCKVIDAKGGIIMPGLVNAHTHTAMTLFRGYADDLPLKTWHLEKIFPAERHLLSHDTVYWGTLLGCLEMIASGTTCLADGYFFQDATVRAVHQSGLRALLAQGIIDFPAPGIPDPRDRFRVGEDFLNRWRHFSNLITPGLFCHSPLTCSAETLKKACHISRKYDLPLQIHLSETIHEVNEIRKISGKRPAMYLENLGILSSDLIAGHGIHLDDAEMAILKHKNTNLVHVPESNMKLSSGIARLDQMIQMNFSVGLGTDGCASNNNLDLFEEMDTAAKLAKVATLKPDGATALEILHMATLGGARVLGLDHLTGSLAPGKKADIIVIDTRAPHLCPLYNPISALVYGANGADVKDVLTNGVLLLKEGEFQSLDSEKIMAEVSNITKQISGMTF